MMSKNKTYLTLIGVFVCFQLVFNVVMFFITFNDLINSDFADCIKYSSIILCFMVSIFAMKTKKGYLITCGLGFTLISDYFLLIRNDHYVLGISIFILAQTCYFLFIMPKHWKISLIIRGSIFLVALILLLTVAEEKEASSYLAAFYFINLVMNTVDAYATKDKGLLTFAIGLTFFIGCDILVFFYNVSDYVTVTSKWVQDIIDFSLEGLWLFYIPSQTFIAISSFFKNNIDEIKRIKSIKQCEE